jgi:hypothetical protein
VETIMHRKSGEDMPMSEKISPFSLIPHNPANPNRF